MLLAIVFARSISSLEDTATRDAFIPVVVEKSPFALAVRVSLQGHDMSAVQATNGFYDGQPKANARVQGRWARTAVQLVQPHPQAHT